MATNSGALSKVAIVTAASRGIGASCARTLKEKGYEVAVMSRSDEIHSIGSKLESKVIVQGSVTKTVDLERLVRLTLDQYGRIDAVVNNSGNPAGGALLEIPDDAWSDVFQIFF